MRNTVSMGIVLAAIGIVASACTFASPTHITMQASEATTGDGGASAPNSATADPAASGCDSAFAKPDVTKLTACAQGKGHCYDKTKVAPAPAGQSDTYVACPNAAEVCVPDEILSAGGNPMKSCTSISGKGGCVNLSILNVPDDERASLPLLKQDVCDPGQNCVPCFDPRNNTNTPFCAPIGVYEKACAASASATSGDAGPPPAPAENCCTTNGKSNGVCIAAASIPDAEKDQTVADTCSGTGQCVPAAFLKGQTVKCDAGLLLGTGFCIDKCFNSMASIAGSVHLLTSDGCEESEVCLPCSFVAGKGVPGCP